MRTCFLVTGLVAIMTPDLRHSVQLHFAVRQFSYGAHGLRYGVAAACLLLIFLLAFCNTSFSQNLSFPGLSNSRHKTIPTAKDSVVIDSFSTAFRSFFIEGISDTSYDFYPNRSLLVWKQKPAADSVTVRYRVLPLSFAGRYSHKSRSSIDTNVLPYVFDREYDQISGFTDNNKLDYNGSYGRSISLGNNQDVVLNSSFNLQANGYILDSIKLEAAITDNTVPFQPEGNTQRLQEFDQILIRLSKNKHLLQLGDYNLESPPVYFLKYFKRVQGLYYQTAFNINKNTTNSLGLSGSVAKGQFARNIFQGLEGNQGPYKLTANNGEQFFIVLAGTEKVYIDNMPMERGENADYIINYNTAEISFMPRKMITKDSRIQVEFEYQDRNYLNSLLYAYDEVQIGKKWRIRLDAYSNQDAKNQPYLQTLDGNQKRFLSLLGDSIQNAYYPSIVTDTFAANKILYKMIDTIVNGISYDSVFVYSNHPDSAIFALAFSYAGANKGNYIIASGNANGRVYDWIAPLNGVPQGSYVPAQLLITPKKQQVFILNTNYQIDSLKALNIEVGASNTDPNLFSKQDNNTHWGLATKIRYRELRWLGKQDSVGNKKWKWDNDLSYEFVQNNFKTVAPYRNVEFGRDWNVSQTNTNKPDEHLIYATTRMGSITSGSVTYNFSYYKRGADYEGYRNILSYEYSHKKIRMGVTGNRLDATDTFQTSQFLRPSLYAEYHLPKLMNTYIGGKYELEKNELRNKQTDTLLPTAFYFDIATAYLRTSDQQPTRWNLNYFTRRDKIARNNQFLDQSRSHNVELKLGLGTWKDHTVNFTGTYRQLDVYDTLYSNLQPEKTLLGRLEYNGSFLKNVVVLNSLYEFGSGQEQKRSYTYVEVPAGQGIYTWNDYNGDGVQQANEFELALYPDQKRFIKVFTPTNDYVKVNYVNFNFSLALEPGSYWEESTKTGFQKFISRFSSQSSLQISNRILANEGLKAYNPFIESLTDTSIILTNTSIGNNIYFNRSHIKWGLDYNMLYGVGKQLLIYGVEGNSNRQHLYKLRWNIAQPLSLNLQARHGKRSYNSALDDNRTYDVKYWSGEPSVTWLYRGVFRLTSGLKYEERKNNPLYGSESANIQSASIEFRYSKPTTGVIQLRGTYSNIQFNGVITAPVAFIMLDALQKGSNYLWYMNWERRVGKGIEILLEYEGRKPGQGSLIHTGRMSVRAIL
ncbi:MAG TPA: hypothetical protein VL098_00195 [Flavipsychrobacter sp.]|nr:hypothetical protein [Flavipsychrobacter sp.]